MFEDRAFPIQVGAYDQAISRDRLERLFPGYVSLALSASGQSSLVRANELLPPDPGFVLGVDIPLTYVRLRREVWTPEVIDIMSRSHRRPIVFEELTAFVERHGSELAFHRIAALGSRLVSLANGAARPSRPRTPVVWSGRYGRDLCFHDGYNEHTPWPAHMVFLAAPIKY